MINPLKDLLETKEDILDRGYLVKRFKNRSIFSLEEDDLEYRLSVFPEFNGLLIGQRISDERLKVLYHFMFTDKVVLKMETPVEFAHSFRRGLKR